MAKFRSILLSIEFFEANSTTVLNAMTHLKNEFEGQMIISEKSLLEKLGEYRIFYFLFRE